MLLTNIIFSIEIVFVYMTVWFLIGYMMKRNDVADFAWGLGFVMIALSLYIKSGLGINTNLLLSALVTIWGLRLSYHIFKRNINKTEDKRYVAWRNTWGKWFVLRSYFQIFILQGVLMLLIISPVYFTNTLPAPLVSVFSIIGLVIWIFGFYFESVGDKQLKDFLSNPENKGKILNTGLWKYTRHPNYFGEVTQWWGVWFVALSSTLYMPFGYFSIVGPLTITFLILKVSGVPMLEKSMEENPLFDEYRKTTSKLFPVWKR
jgi:steroid 5-alpha reductase family enzyme